MFSSFMINPWIVVTLVAIVAGLVGFFVVLRGASFAAHALPLGTFPGAALAGLLGINSFIGLITFAGLGVMGINQLAKNGRHEVATALTLVMLLSLGTVFLSLSSQYSQQVYALLFGEVLGVSRAELVPVALISLLVIGITMRVFYPLLLNSVSAELAEVQGISVKKMELWFLCLLALATAMALPVVGALLVFSLMVAPAAVAHRITSRPIPAVLLSIAVSLITVWLAIALSYETNWPVGFFVGSIGGGLFIATFL
ncbi:metal ABC transporter permease [Rouxiella badensis]|jgi:zinc/manganese transport system permease protein|uniref:Cation ABC transporter permease n=1 Tax=Rouxiella badensis TaxID=1646377 RepID=A0A1X0WIP0_9GAMM|nr:metal ABC transporter permease [Rouxiella badensis]MCC3701750.1 metal ABC transporter permease [Rouxiella badensis]MCC3720062.1 metal ABC transporter permease [Rouxiella badensis]MCC3729725.1 metal ABC transporter permease [Rouxiella badensis]MCC3731392.1 metal ABC transporter permease [Rouxiella badensis]MCC3738327.1 metal ABC transporter permease [Rouxiella badensis]